VISKVWLRAMTMGAGTACLWAGKLLEKRKAMAMATPWGWNWGHGRVAPMEI
jgi:hypothetical protein